MGSRALVQVVAIALLTSLLSGCDQGEPGASPSQGASVEAAPVKAAGTVTSGSLTVDLPQQPDVDVTVATDTSEGVRSALVDYLDGGTIVGRPVQIEADEAVGTAVISRTYPAALPSGVAATLAYWNETAGTWIAVPSSLSPDRRTVTATVTHLSTWTDIVGGATDAVRSTYQTMVDAGEAAVDAAASVATWGAEWAYYGVGSVFDTRVSKPSCASGGRDGDNGEPDWVDEVISVDDKNNVIRWCTGHDPKNADLLVVKGAVNRGFGMRVATAVGPTWHYSSTYDPDLLSEALDAAVALDDLLSRNLALINFDPMYVGPGEFTSFGFAEDAVRDADVGEPLVEFAKPRVLDLLFGTLGNLTGKAVTDKIDGYLGAAIAIGSCARDLNNVDDVLSAAKALLGCLSSAYDAGPNVRFAQSLSAGIAKRHPGWSSSQVNAQAGKLAGRVTIALGLIGPVFNTMNFVAEQHSNAATRQLTVFPRLAPRPSGEVPLELSGNWCTSDGVDCLDLDQLSRDYPDFFLDNVARDPDGSVFYSFCTANDLGEYLGSPACTVAASIYLTYFPPGVIWDCEEELGVDSYYDGCDPDYTEEHDTSQPRLVVEMNHQQGTSYADSPPRYR